MNPFDFLILLCAIGSGLVAGIFFVFSFGIMKALRKLPTAEGVAAMQMINITIINPQFLAVFLGTALACSAALVAGILLKDSPGRPWVLGGAVLYLCGSFFVTRRFNVPRNDRLAATRANGPDAAAVWEEYLRSWTAWNHVRTAASLGAVVLFLLALLSSQR